MEIDLLVVHPDNCDYPLFRKFLIENRDLFKDVFIAFTRSNKADERAFVRNSLQALNIHFLEPETPNGRDWRDYATNEMLKLSKSKYVLFMEQDFFITRESLERIMNKRVDCVGFYENETRLHPAFLLIDRLSLNLTGRNFAANPPDYDHFGMIQKKLEQNDVRIATLEQLNVYYEHMAGLSHNLTLLQDGKKVTYKPQQLSEYFEKCEKCGVKLPMNFFRMQTLLREQLEYTG